MPRLTLPAPAKINLILNVLDKRTDGYHELETIMHQVSLLDILHFEIIPEGIVVESNSSLIPHGKDNLAYQAAALIMEIAGIKAGVSVFIEKNIPVGAGLAGGSTDAATVLLGLDRLFSLRFSMHKLQELAARIGSDVPFCLGNDTCIAKGRGELLTSLARGPRLDLLVVVPDFQVSTADVYRAYKRKKDYQPADTAAFIEAWQRKNIFDIAGLLSNDLETVSTQTYDEIDYIKKDLIQAGAINALMSGSGPAVFGIFQDHETALKAWSTMQKNYQRTYQVTSFYRGD